MTPRFWLLQSCGAVLVGLGMGAGFVLPVFADDATYLTHGITALFLAGVAMAAAGRWNDVRRCGRFLVAFGLLGTVIGFRIALSGVSPEAAGDAGAIQPMVASLIAGMGTALSTTIAGLIGSLWLRLTVWLIEPR